MLKLKDKEKMLQIRKVTYYIQGDPNKIDSWLPGKNKEARK